VDELKVGWDDDTCKFIHKKFYEKSYHNDVKYHVTPNTLFSVDVCVFWREQIVDICLIVIRVVQV
jgi:hypothetical protein